MQQLLLCVFGANAFPPRWAREALPGKRWHGTRNAERTRNEISWPSRSIGSRSQEHDSSVMALKGRIMVKRLSDRACPDRDRSRIGSRFFGPDREIQCHYGRTTKNVRKTDMDDKLRREPGGTHKNSGDRAVTGMQATWGVTASWGTP